VTDDAGSPSFRLGIDIGGTFTDLVLMNERDGSSVSLKTPSVPSDPAQAVLNGVSRLIEREGIAPGAIRYFVHGTTLGVNTLLERAGAVTGLLVTRGFLDLLEIGRLRLPDPTNYTVEKIRPLVPRHLVREIGGRLLADGSEYAPLDLAEVEQAASELVAEGIGALALCFMHAYQNGRHEQAAEKAIRDRFPSLYVCRSSSIWPQQREYERGLITVINAYVGRRMQRYFQRLQANMTAASVMAPLLTTKSNGGIMAAADAGDVPVETLLSGPASGVMGAREVGRVSSNGRLIALDMGGTSTDVAVIDGDVLYSTESHIGDFPVILPAVDVSSIGAGGGSIAWLDPSGILKVGPRSAGADPGPACYGRGGTQPTVTDAYLGVGILGPAQLLGGTVQLDTERAQAALAALGKGLGLDAVGTAAAMLDVTTANMYAQFMPLMARKGIDPRDFAILAFGGAGPTHALMLARETGITRVVVPAQPGTLCALGSLVTDLRQDFIRSVPAAERRADRPGLAARYAPLEARARTWLAGQDTQVSERRLLHSADMRYRGQSFDITVPLADPAGTPDALLAEFHERYRRIYGFADAKAVVEMTNLRVTALGVTPKPAMQGVDPGKMHQRKATPIATRTIHEGGKPQQAAIYERTDLAAGETLSGPAVVEATDTTIYVPAGFDCHVDPWGNLIAERAS
jgi:N-methylhydantoinase A